MKDDPTGSAADLPTTSDVSTSDDPRVAAALEEYLAGLQAGRRPSRREFLARHPEIAAELEQGLDVLEFLHSAGGLAGRKSQPPQECEALPPETVLGDYRLIREVGRGGMGVVYEAHQISLGRRVAVKVLSGAGVPDPRRLERFRIEAQAVALLSHPHIVPIFAVGCDRGIHYYAMQYIEGRTLAEVLDDRSGARRGSAAISTPAPDGAGPSTFVGGEPYRAIARLGIEAAEALDHAHAMGVLHRDVKPSNLLIDARGSLWIADFGLARFRDDPGLTITGDLVGTLRYMAPEMAMGRRMSFDPRADIYSLGATLYELTTRRPVFDGADRRELLRQIAQDDPVSPRRIDRAIPRDLETIVMKAMDKEPGRRYPTAVEMADDLRRFLDDQPILARPPSPWERAAKLARRHRAVLMAVASVTLIAIGIGSALVWQEQRRTAEVNEDRLRVLGEGLGAFNLLTMADELTMKGMERLAISAHTPEEQKDLRNYYAQAIAFYERVTGEPSIDSRSRALAFRRLGFTRMVSSNDPRAEGDYRRALEIYEALLREEPEAPDLKDALADIHYNLGIWRMSRPGGILAAEASFRKSIDILEHRVIESPTHPGLLEALAGQRLQLAEWMEQTAAMQPRERGRLEQEARREKDAVFELLDRLTTRVVDPVPPGSRGEAVRWASDAYRSLALQLSRRRWTVEQEKALRLGLRFEPDRPELLYDLASLLAFRTGAEPKAVAEAVALAEKAADAMPARREYWRILALARVHAKDWRGAAAAIDRSLRLQGEDGQASDRLVMAMLSWQSGSPDDAKGWYLRALDRMARQPNDDPDAPKFWSEAQEALRPILVAEHLSLDKDR